MAWLARFVRICCSGAIKEGSHACSQEGKMMVSTQHRTTDPQHRLEGVHDTPPPTPTEHEVASLLSNLELYEQALLVYEEAIEQNPADPLAYIGKGNMLLFLGE